MHHTALALKLTARSLGAARTCSASRWVRATIILMNTLKSFMRVALAAGLSLGAGRAAAQVTLDPAVAVQIIKGPYLQNVTTNSVVVMWETQIPADTRVEYGVNSTAESSVLNAASVTNHQITLPLLAANTRYYYTVRSGDAQSTTNSFITAPVGENVPFRFVAYGDTRTQVTKHALVAESIVRSDPDFVLHVGDQVANGRVYAEWGPQFFAPAANMLKRAPLFPVLGNHEFSGSGKVYYYDFFDVPANGVSGYGEHFYAFTYGCARFVALSACEGGCDSFTPGSAQYNWLLQELQSPVFQQAKWRFVWDHNPPYTAKERDNQVNVNLRTYLVPLFEQYGVDVVFSGDDHFYRHSERNGIHYIVTGGGGAPLHAVGTQVSGATLLYAESNYEHCVIDLNPSVFRFYALRTNDTIMDSLLLVKDTTAPVISAVAAVDITSTNARVTWATDEPANSRVDYGLTAAYGDSASDVAMVTAHTITLSNLQPRTTYHCRVSSTNFADLFASSADFTFQTLPPPNHPPVAAAEVAPLFRLSDTDVRRLIVSPNNLDAAVTLDGSASWDADSDPLEFGWFERDPANPCATGVRTTTTMAVGQHTVSLVVYDGQDTGTTHVAFEVIRPSYAVNLVGQLLEGANLGRRHAQPLLASLNGAAAAFDRGNFGAGANILQAFTHKVRAQVAPVNPVLASELTRLAQQIVVTVRSE